MHIFIPPFVEAEKSIGLTQALILKIIEYWLYMQKKYRKKLELIA